MCRSSSPLNTSPSSSKAALLGSVHATPGVTGPRTPAARWVLRELGRVWIRDWIFSSEDGEKVYGMLPWECLLLFEAPVLVAALISGKGLFYLLLFLSFPSSLTRLFHQLRFWADLLGDLLLALALSLHSFPISPFQSTPSPLSHSHPHSPLCFLCCTPLSFSFPPISSILPFQHMTDCVINEHHKPLFLLATH